MIRYAAPALLLLTAAAPPAPSPAYDRAIAAGYKALTLCNGIFLGGRTEAQIAADELAGIYPEYQAIVSSLEADVDKQRGVVLVNGSKDMPPRRAVYGSDNGCTLRPNGYVEPDSVHGGAIIYPGSPASPPGADARAWPQGDGTGAIRRLKPLRELIARAFDATSFGAGSKTTGVVVLHDGQIAAERYASGWGPYVPNRTWSAAKSIAGTLAGLANEQTRGRDRPDMTDIEHKLEARRGPMSAVDPYRSARIGDVGGFDPRRRITLDNLLRMASGLHSDTAGNRTDALYTGLTTVDQETTAWPLEAPPGMRFRYANNDILLAVLSLRGGLGEDRYRTFPHDALFAPLGMAHTWAGTDWHGNYLLSSQVWSTARDLARLGQFWLQDGVWQGKRLLPDGWMRYMTTPSGPQPADGPGYGATLWLFGPKQGLPAGSYAAQGNRGQFVMVVPSEKLVVVRRGEDPAGARFGIAAFTAEVIEALR